MSKERATKIDQQRLIALEGEDWAEVQATARELKRLFCLKGFGCIISRWNSSGLFSQISERSEELQQLSPRTLALLYAVDLAGRIKEIVPALQAGFFVIAAQYLHTPQAIALAMGAEPTWLSNLMAFAPPPGITFHVRPSQKKRLNGAGNGHSPNQGVSDLVKEGFGFYEYCLNFVIAKSSRYEAKSLEQSMEGYFDSLRAQNTFNVVRSADDPSGSASILQRFVG